MRSYRTACFVAALAIFSFSFTVGCGGSDSSAPEVDTPSATEVDDSVSTTEAADGGSDSKPAAGSDSK